MIIRVFGEGRTEESVIRHLEPTTDLHLHYVNVRGKDNFPQAIRDRLGPDLDEHSGVRFVILRDRDQGEELADIQRSLQNAIQDALSERGYEVSVQLVAHPAHSNVLISQTLQPSTRFALHVAQPTPDINGWQFTKSTTDDYVLALALLPPVASRFIQQSHVTATPEDFRHKVLREVPDLFSRNGIPLDEAKDLVGIYMAAARFVATRRTEQPDTFAGIVVDRARKYADDELRQVLASFLAAVQFVAIGEDEE